jgi:hypothetical protein
MEAPLELFVAYWLMGRFRRNDSLRGYPYLIQANLNRTIRMPLPRPFKVGSDLVEMNPSRSMLPKL